jgi:hypothetical protein
VNATEQDPLPAKIVEWQESAGRIVVTGWPRSGKSTLASRLESIGITVYDTDILVDTHSWSEASEEVARWMAEPGPWVISGVTALRGLRKRMAAIGGRPCDLLVWCSAPKVPVTFGQRSMGRGQDTIFAGIRSELVRRGVEILDVA